jgi:hypothetical protein
MLRFQQLLYSCGKNDPKTQNKTFDILLTLSKYSYTTRKVIPPIFCFIYQPLSSIVESASNNHLALGSIEVKNTPHLY